MSKKFQCPSGMHDIFGERYENFEKVMEVVKRNASIYGFRGIVTPVIEDSGVFTSGIGRSTDIVEKEMYSFKTKRGDNVSLRPEGTAPVMRAYLEHNLYTRPQPIKFFYFSPFFRYERQQAGRYRQFWQFGFEVIGKGSPAIDAQIIIAVFSILGDLGIENVKVKINHIGDEKCRSKFKLALRKYLKEKEASLCEDCKKRTKENPLRTLDCKKCSAKENAPQAANYLCRDCREEFQKVLEFLEEMEIPYEPDPLLVRGLDYYTGVVYEFVSTKESSLLEIGGGGRYNELSVSLGAEEEIPASGVAMGVERVIDLMKKEGKIGKNRENPKVFIAQLGEMAKKKALKLFEEFRKAGLDVAESFGRDSLKSQLGRADKMGVLVTIIIGKEEAIEDKVILRDMESGKQEKVEIKNAIKETRKIIKERKSKSSPSF